MISRWFTDALGITARERVHRVALSARYSSYCMRVAIVFLCAAVAACAQQDQRPIESKPALAVADTSSTPVADSQPVPKAWAPNPLPAPGATTFSRQFSRPPQASARLAVEQALPDPGAGCVQSQRHRWCLHRERDSGVGGSLLGSRYVADPYTQREEWRGSRFAEQIR